MRSTFRSESVSSIPKGEEGGPAIPVVHPFPITCADRERVWLESLFALMYYLGMTFTEAVNLPIPYREWFLRRTEKTMQGTAGDGEPGNGSTKDMRAQNDPMVAMSQGKHRVQTPARLRRF